MFEGVMMPELYLADALGAAGKPMLRVHTAGSVGGSTAIVATHLVEAGDPRARAHGRVREAVRGQRAVGSRRRPERQHGRGRRSSRRGSARTSSRSGAPEHIGWQVAVKDRLNALKNPYAHLQAPRHHHREGARVADAVGPDPLPRVVPVVRRRVRDGARRRRGREDAPSRPAWVHGHGDAQRAGHVPRPRPGATRRPASTARRRLHAGRHHQPARADRRAPRSTCRSAGTSRCGSRTSASPSRRGLEDDRQRRHRARRRLPGEPVGRRALVEPDRRVGHDPLRRGRAAGAGQGRRAPGRRARRSRSATPTAATRSTSPWPCCRSRRRRSERRRSPRAGGVRHDHVDAGDLRPPGDPGPDGALQLRHRLRNWDGLDDVFTPDAHIDYSVFGGSVGNLAETKAFLTEAMPMFTTLQHMVSGTTIAFDGATLLRRRQDPVPQPDDHGRRREARPHGVRPLVRRQARRAPPTAGASRSASRRAST